MVAAGINFKVSKIGYNLKNLNEDGEVRFDAQNILKLPLGTPHGMVFMDFMGVLIEGRVLDDSRMGWGDDTLIGRFGISTTERKYREFFRHEFWPQSWNNGIVERWNSGFLEDIIHFKVLCVRRGGSYTQYCSILSEP